MNPSEIKDFYERLGVSPTSSENEIKSAYRALALTWHPDKNPVERKRECELEFIAISEAYTATSSEAREICDNLPRPKREDDFYKFYNDMLNAMDKTSPELAAMTRMFCGSGSPAMRSIFEDMFR